MYTDKKTIISMLVPGQMYTLIPVEEFKNIDDFRAALWVRGNFNKKNGKYECYKYFDNDFKVYRRGNSKAFTYFLDYEDISRLFPVDK